MNSDNQRCGTCNKPFKTTKGLKGHGPEQCAAYIKRQTPGYSTQLRRGRNVRYRVKKKKQAVAATQVNATSPVTVDCQRVGTLRRDSSSEVQVDSVSAREDVAAVDGEGCTRAASADANEWRIEVSACGDGASNNHQGDDTASFGRDDNAVVDSTGAGVSSSTITGCADVVTPSVEDEACVICKEDILRGKDSAVTECVHRFHTRCLLNWNMNSFHLCEQSRREVECRCPLCNQNLVATRFNCPVCGTSTKQDADRFICRRCACVIHFDCFQDHVNDRLDAGKTPSCYVCKRELTWNEF